MKPKTMVYVCSDPENIYKIFSSIQKAEEFCKEHLPDGSIDVWELDEDEDEESLTRYFIKISKEGKVLEFLQNADIPSDVKHSFTTDMEGNLYIHCKTETDEQALAFANKCRQELFPESIKPFPEKFVKTMEDFFQIKEEKGKDGKDPNNRTSEA